MFLNINPTAWSTEPCCAPACWVIPSFLLFLISMRNVFAGWQRWRPFLGFGCSERKGYLLHWDTQEELSEMLMNILLTVLQICLCVCQNWGGQSYCPPVFCECGDVENNGMEVLFLHHLKFLLSRMSSTCATSDVSCMCSLNKTDFWIWAEFGRECVQNWETCTGQPLLELHTWPGGGISRSAQINYKEGENDL